ncbi:MAG: hypothetical protein JWN20_1389, partial [Jatrophihabitantaceae bacterium]|nr:hypothetical protein [Jatrophihabitantaceae bacterium]
CRCGLRWAAAAPPASPENGKLGRFGEDRLNLPFSGIYEASERATVARRRRIPTLTRRSSTR